MTQQHIIQITLTPQQLRQIIAEEVAKLNVTQSPKPYGDILTRKEAAAILKVSPRTIKNWDAAGLIPREQLPGRMVRYTYDNVRTIGIAKGLL